MAKGAGNAGRSSSGGGEFTLLNEAASYRVGVAGDRDAFEIRLGDARATGYVANADFPGERGKPTRGELFFVEAGSRLRSGKGTALTVDALRLMRYNGAKTVNISTTSDAGRWLVASLLRKKIITGPIKTSQSGKAEYRIGTLPIREDE